MELLEKDWLRPLVWLSQEPPNSASSNEMRNRISRNRSTESTGCTADLRKSLRFAWRNLRVISISVWRSEGEYLIWTLRLSSSLLKTLCSVPLKGYGDESELEDEPRRHVRTAGSSPFIVVEMLSDSTNMPTSDDGERTFRWLLRGLRKIEIGLSLIVLLLLVMAVCCPCLVASYRSRVWHLLVANEWASAVPVACTKNEFQQKHFFDFQHQISNGFEPGESKFSTLAWTWIPFWASLVESVLASTSSYVFQNLPRSSLPYARRVVEPKNLWTDSQESQLFVLLCWHKSSFYSNSSLGLDYINSFSPKTF